MIDIKTGRVPVKKKARKPGGEFLGIILGGVSAAVLTVGFLLLRPSQPVESASARNVPVQQPARPVRQAARPPVKPEVKKPEIQAKPVKQPVFVQENEPKKVFSQVPVYQGAVIVGTPFVVSPSVVRMSIKNDSPKQIDDIPVEIDFGGNVLKDVVRHRIKPGETKEFDSKFVRKEFLECWKTALEQPDNPIQIRVEDGEFQDLRFEMSEFERSVFRAIGKYQRKKNELTQLQFDAIKDGFLLDLGRELQLKFSGLRFPIENVSAGDRGRTRIELSNSANGLVFSDVHHSHIEEKIKPSLASSIGKSWIAVVKGTVRFSEGVGGGVTGPRFYVTAGRYRVFIWLENPKYEFIDPADLEQP